MTTIEEAICNRLEARAELTALIGTAPTRLYPMLPQEVAYPAVRYSLVGIPFRNSTFGQDDGLVKARYQFESWGRRKLDVVNTSREVRRALQRWGQDGPPEVQDTFILTEIDADDEAEQLFRRILDAEITWRETV